MNKQVNNLIQKALRGKISSEEKAALDQWYLEQERAEVKLRDHKGRNKQQVKEELFSSIERHTSPSKALYPKSQTHFTHVRWAVAASLVLVMAFGWLMKGVWSPEQEIMVAEDSFELFENPTGVKRKIKLPDGTVIHLNHNSKIYVYKDFNQRRLTKLEGEAFFDVARNEALPFTIQTEKLETVVLGTSFNIQARKGMAEKVAVRSGKVRVALQGDKDQAHFLEKDQQLQLIDENAEVDNIPDLEKEFGWMEGKLVFRQNKMPEVVKMLEDWYGVQIEADFKTSISCELTGTYQNMKLEDLLEAVKYSIPMNYNIKDKNVNIRFKGC
ncbi:FecR family protein [Echinicola sp. 20G]|uniref:FecR family protein n=1 Tax=Echinicola sp. 20G TaxID=2781961 RepID=UPI0019105A42|nr:FecR family protein [Echinicola sp. 20G]